MTRSYDKQAVRPFVQICQLGYHLFGWGQLQVSRQIEG
jgi:hypothetical protein